MFFANFKPEDILTSNALNFLKKLEKAIVLCLGDLMLDRYIYGEANRLSPEAPVPIISVRRKTIMPGGLGNVIMNLRSIGSTALSVGLTGDDDNSRELSKLLLTDNSNDNADISFIIDHDRPTTVKTRIIAGIQQVVRFDEESTKPLSKKIGLLYRQAVQEKLNRVGALALSDYGKGVLDRDMTLWLITEARKAGKPVVVDPKGTDYSLYSGATLVTPNRHELSLAVGQDISRAPVEVLAKAGRKLMEKHKLENLLITRSEDGMTLLGSKGQTVNMPTRAREVFDVSGAGDTVVAVLAASLAVGLPLETGAFLATLAAGVVVGKVGTATATPEEITEAFKF